MNKKQERLHFNEKFEEFCPTALHEFFFEISKDYVIGKKVLDIGCWTGGYLYFLQNCAAFICALDIEERAIAIAKENLPLVKFLKSNTLNLPFQPETFDTVTMWAVIEHIPKDTEDLALKEINRILNPQGIVCINTMNDHFLSKILDPAYFLKGHRHYTIESLEHFLKRAGFKILEVYKNGGVFTSMYLNMLYLVKYIFGRKMPRFKVMEEWQKKDYYKEGFNEINIIAQKI